VSERYNIERRIARTQHQQQLENIQREQTSAKAEQRRRALLSINALRDLVTRIIMYLLVTQSSENLRFSIDSIANI